MTDNYEKFNGSLEPYESADIVLLGAPFDSTTSFRPGARFGPKSIRSYSIGIETYSPGLHEDLKEARVHDAGDLELPAGDVGKSLKIIEDRICDIAKEGKIPLLLGGEHLITLGAVRAFKKVYPDLKLIHFDAHADLRGEYKGMKYSNKTVIRRCWDELGDGNIFQYGIRSGAREEFDWIRQGHTEMSIFGFQSLNETITELEGQPIYLTIDLDVLDPSVLPGTANPDPGGVSYVELLRDIREVIRRSRVVGLDIVELAPDLDPSHMSSIVAAKLVREVALSLT